MTILNQKAQKIFKDNEVKILSEMRLKLLLKYI